MTVRPDLCLDFANTRYWRGQAIPTETLNAPDDLAAWAKAPKAPPPREFEQALALRESIYRLFDGQAQGRGPAPRDLETLNQALARAPARTTLKRGKDGYQWEVDARSGTALALLAPVLWSAGDLLGLLDIGAGILAGDLAVGKGLHHRAEDDGEDDVVPERTEKLAGEEERVVAGGFHGIRFKL